MWGRYIERRLAIKQAREAGRSVGAVGGPVDLFDPPAKTDEIARSHPDMFEPLDEYLNEVYLWHGCHVRHALSIAQSDFCIDMAGSSRGTMYGAGAYFAESSTKADEYAKDEPEGFYKGVYAVLLCRVTMGKFFYTEQRDESAAQKVESGDFDSTLGDRLKAAGTFREFVVYNADQVYPEYVILYERVYKGSESKRRDISRRSTFHMQLPIYWCNCHKNPEVDPFHEQYVIRLSTREILQRLVAATYTNKGQRLRIAAARRIENSHVWCSYVASKKRLWAQLMGAEEGFKPANELDGDEASGNVLTSVHLRGECIEESISVSNLEEPLNEYLLWHGTSKRAAETIVCNDFTIAQGAAVKHGKRFGPGAYFAEDLVKSLSYAEEADGIRYVLLCRVLCGDIHYTEAWTEKDADQVAARQGKNSVLANPSTTNHPNKEVQMDDDGKVKKGPREFIIHDNAQVYPEYILELKVVYGISDTE